LPLAFDHPLWILYSSGTTGKPKAIVQSHGGILLEHLKALALHQDLGPGERFFWYSTTGWMMWNYLVSGLLVGACVVLYDGSPTLEKLGVLWRLAEQEKLQHFGASAPYFMACRSRGLEPAAVRDLSVLRFVGSTGAPLPDLGFEWVYEKVAPRVHLGSISGGTDLCTAFVTSCPWLPVRAGELQCSALGADVQAFDESGQRVSGRVGELVIVGPMPSMPIGFWGDPDGARYRASYFEKFPGVWRHGDWLLQFPDGGAVISGRSDATLNRGGVRMGTSEFYRILESVAELEDSLVVERNIDASSSELWLFVVLAQGHALDEELTKRIKRLLAAELSPRHVPDVVCRLTRIPYTLSGKKLEVPVKRLLEGAQLESVAALDTLREPLALLELEAAARPLLRRSRRS
jgi:acetoacetyl-CoA synthetase